MDGIAREVCLISYIGFQPYPARRRGGDPFAAADPFATVDGITGVIKLKNSGRATGAGVYDLVQGNGKLIGTGVTLEMVRSYAQIMAILARTDFGA